MHTIIWRYVVQSDRTAVFERHYAADGTWAQLFRRSPDYQGTALLRDTGQSHVYVTLDHWTSEAAFTAFKAAFAADYQVLDESCEGLTLTEERLGAVTSPS